MPPAGYVHRYPITPERPVLKYDKTVLRVAYTDGLLQADFDLEDGSDPMAQLREKEETLREERRKTEELSTRLAELSGPQINVALFSLGAVRGEGEQNRVAIGTHPAWLVLSIELPATGGGPYRAALLDSHGRAVWSGSGLRPTVSDTVLLGLFSSLLSPGDYRLVLVGTGSSPQRIEVPFVVTRPRTLR